MDIDITGATVVRVREMTRKELEGEGWAEDRHGARTAIVFSDGSVVYASRDDEGNGPGALFGYNKKFKSRFSL